MKKSLFKELQRPVRKSIVVRVEPHVWEQVLDLRQKIKDDTGSKYSLNKILNLVIRNGLK